jgi:hypothetical protein
MSPQDYIDSIKVKLAQSVTIQSYVIVNEMILPDRGHFRVRLVLSNGDFVEATEFFFVRASGIEQQRYRYQWMNSGQTHLKKRWDNAPHFPDIATYPHHVHVDSEDNVLPSRMFGISELIDILEQEIAIIG